MAETELREPACGAGGKGRHASEKRRSPSVRRGRQDRCGAGRPGRKDHGERVPYKKGCKALNILVTGGAGYIGSHTLVELINAGHSVFVVDNLINSSRESLRRVEQLTGSPVPFRQVDIRDRAGLEAALKDHSFDCCIHFAGVKAAGESVSLPWEYYENNISGTLVLNPYPCPGNTTKTTSAERWC